MCIHSLVDKIRVCFTKDGPGPTPSTVDSRNFPAPGEAQSSKPSQPTTSRISRSNPTPTRPARDIRRRRSRPRQIRRRSTLAREGRPKQIDRERSPPHLPGDPKKKHSPQLENDLDRGAFKAHALMNKPPPGEVVPRKSKARIEHTVSISSGFRQPLDSDSDIDTLRTDRRTSASKASKHAVAIPNSINPSSLEPTVATRASSVQERHTSPVNVLSLKQSVYSNEIEMKEGSAKPPVSVTAVAHKNNRLGCPQHMTDETTTDTEHGDFDGEPRLPGWSNR